MREGRSVVRMHARRPWKGRSRGTEECHGACEAARDPRGDAGSHGQGEAGDSRREVNAVPATAHVRGPGGDAGLCECAGEPGDPRDRRMSGAGSDRAFAGSIPKIYQQYLVPLLFESYAADLASRLAARSVGRVLETASGTGAVTRAIASAL